MSFSYNPFMHVEIADDPPVEDYSTNQNPDTYAIHCHGCGSTKNRVAKDAPISLVFEIMSKHLRKSHDMLPEEVADWSVY